MVAFVFSLLMLVPWVTNCCSTNSLRTKPRGRAANQQCDHLVEIGFCDSIKRKRKFYRWQTFRQFFNERYVLHSVEWFVYPSSELLRRCQYSQFHSGIGNKFRYIHCAGSAVCWRLRSECHFGGVVDSGEQSNPHGQQLQPRLWHRWQHRHDHGQRQQLARHPDYQHQRTGDGMHPPKREHDARHIQLPLEPGWQPTL